VCLAIGIRAQPTIAPGGIYNSASYNPSGLPNGDIAQGSVIAIFGSNLGPANVAQQPSYPLQTTLAGTSIKITVNGTTVDAIPIYTLAGQVGAVVPSRTPVGTGTLTLTYNGQTSAPAPIKIVPNSFGTFAANSQGSGPGSITDVNYSSYSLANSAKAGDSIIIWGTGLGAITENDADTPKPRDLTNIPVQVYIGGKVATVRYRGRSGCCAGIDQIIADIPQGVEGCYVAVVIVVNNIPSNVTTIPISNGSSRVCSDANGISNTDLQTLLNQGTFSIGSILLSRNTTQTPAIGPLPASTSTTDSGTALFVKFDASVFNTSLGLFQTASFGSCIVSWLRSGQTSPTIPKYTILDAGPAININGPNGAKSMTKQQGIYIAELGGGTGSTAQPPYIPANGGSFRFDNGAGGADVKAFSNVQLNVASPLVWTNMDAIPNTIPRSQNLRVTWSGGDPNSYVSITGSSFTQNPNLITTFSCSERVAAGSFEVPSYVLQSLVPSVSIGGGGFNVPAGSLSVGNFGNPVKFSAPGIDQGFAVWSVASGKSVNYQ
jgi:uncharacterized protein (TIGR03437 family)